MKSLLILYMYELFIENPKNNILGHSHINSSIAQYFNLEAQPQIISQVYGLYFGLVWAMPILGGIIADRWMTRTRTIVLGSVIMAIGHFTFLFSDLFYVSLFLVALGSGLFKPNLATQVGELYVDDPSLRDSGYVISYAGICMGAFAAPIVCGFLAKSYGWHIGFSAAGFGMFLGLIIYISGKKHLPSSKGLLKVTNSVEGGDVKNIVLLILTFVVGGVFWAIFEQQGNSLQLFVNSYVRLSFYSFDIPPVWYQALGSLFLIIITPGVLYFWSRMEKRGPGLSTLSKMSLGCLFMAFSFSIILLAIQSSYGLAEKISILWIMMFSLSVAFSEIFFSPAGTSLISKYSPPHLVGLMMGVACISGVLGNVLGGYLGTFYSQISPQSFFSIFIYLSFAIALIFYGLSKFFPEKNSPGDRSLGY